MRTFILAFVAVLVSGFAYADCDGAPEGALNYDSTSKTIVFCNGTGWREVSKTTLTSCSGVVEGATEHDATTKNFKFCDGTNWQLMDKVAAGCSTSPTTWLTNCSGTVSATTHGATSSPGYDGTGGAACGSGTYYSGTATFTCADDEWVYTSGSCTSDTQAACASCSGQGVAWGNCSGSVSSQSHGGSRGASDPNSAVCNDDYDWAGSATFTCNNGSWSYAGGSCTYQPGGSSCGL